MSRLMTRKQKRESAERERRERNRMEEVKRRERLGLYGPLKYLNKKAEPKGVKEHCNLSDGEEEMEEMRDFIVEEDEEISSKLVSSHIRTIFGYDKRRFADESDMDLRHMDANFGEVEKEERTSMRLGRKEDLDDMRLEREQNKRKKMKMSKGK
ncbi:GL26354 [Drosophila persimilis]|uniref:GL26354 n=1 Tax=Drosophila persimilis TaxID=7234 RepID=B4GT60_DROPE|nr:protein SPT2 homolog [Drosophila persimilis]EDW25569.1 GL26354 [Drosophila persimilis]